MLIGTRYNVAVSGETIKAVTCDACGRDYSYGLLRTGRGMGMSLIWTTGEQARAYAEAQARKQLEKALDKGTDLAACPGCGRYQRNMIRRDRFGKFFKFLLCYVPGVLLVCLRVSFLLPDPKANLTELCVLGGALLVGTAMGAWILLRNYNADAPSRAAKG